MLKVAKFGGSSVANSEQLKKVKQIIETDPDRRFVVTSAAGKSKSDDYKVTDLLYLTYAHIKYGVNALDIFNLIETKYKNIVNELSLNYDIDKDLDEIKNQLKKNISEDYLVSRGEYLSSKILASYLGYTFLDAKDFISFDFNKKIDLVETKKKFDSLFEKEKKYVFPGFYGSMPNGDIRVMSRGGSDITGSIIANIINADIYENWTDVSGILVCDPRIVNNPKSIKYITYEELREMSYMGANVLHDEAIFPVKDKNIPINIRNTNDYLNEGTYIFKSCEEVDKKEKPPTITGITGRKDFWVFTVRKAGISNVPGVIFKALEIFTRFNVSIESVPASVDTFSIVVEEAVVEKYQYEIINALKEELETDDIMITKDISLIAVVGRGLVSNIGIAGKIFDVVGQNNISIRLINQDTDEINITIGVENKYYEDVINCLYNKFMKD